MTAPTIPTDLTGLARETLDATLPDHAFALHLVAADGAVLFAPGEHTRAYCLAMVDTLLWIFDDAHGWELVEMSSGECVMAGVRGEGAS